MELENYLSKQLSSIEGSTGYDAVCKRVLANKVILARLLKDSVGEFKDVEIQTIIDECLSSHIDIGTVSVHPDEKNLITQANSEDVTLYEGIVRYDIRTYVTMPNTQGKVRIIVNVEAQDDFNPGYNVIHRSVYYMNRLVSSQKSVDFEKSNYDDIKGVYTIWIFTNPPKRLKGKRTRVRLAEFPDEDECLLEQSDYDLMSGVYYFLGDEENKGKGTLRLLEVTLSRALNVEEKRDILEKEFGIVMNEEMEKEMSEMCDLSKGIARENFIKGWYEGEKSGEERGEKRGEERGEKRGEKRGEERGKKRTLEANIKTIMNKLSLTAEQAMDILDIPQNERSGYAQKIFDQRRS